MFEPPLSRGAASDAPRPRPRRSPSTRRSSRTDRAARSRFPSTPQRDYDSATPPARSRSGPATMSDDVGFEVLRAIRRIIRRVAIYSRDLSRTEGMTVPQLMCLRAIGRPADPGVEKTVGWVSGRVSLSATTVSRIVERLVKAGLVDRHRSETDRRKVLLDLTADGQERFRHLPTPLDEQFVARLEALPAEEQDRLLGSLLHIIELMDAHKVDAAPMLVESAEMHD